MTKLSKTLVTGIAILSMSAMTQFVWTDIAAACGYGQSGGSGYVPQRRDSDGFLYEVEVVDAGNEIVQLLGVDKRSGRLILLN